MPSIRSRVRTDKWILINVTWEERKKHNVSHFALNDWTRMNCIGNAESTMKKEYGGNPSSAFVFENESDASMFALRWK